MISAYRSEDSCRWQRRECDFLPCATRFCNDLAQGPRSDLRVHGMVARPGERRRGRLRCTITRANRCRLLEQDISVRYNCAQDTKWNSRRLWRSFLSGIERFFPRPEVTPRTLPGISFWSNFWHQPRTLETLERPDKKNRTVCK